MPSPMAGQTSLLRLHHGFCKSQSNLLPVVLKPVPSLPLAGCLKGVFSTVACTVGELLYFFGRATSKFVPILVKSTGNIARAMLDSCAGDHQAELTYPTSSPLLKTW